MQDPRTSLPPLNWLRAFESAARNLSFTAAASDLNMTQSAVSQQIKSLEQRLGRTLFIRRTRSIELTDAGLSYLPVVQEAFEVLTTGTRMMTGGDRGKILAIQCNLAFSVFWLAPRLGRLCDQHPWLILNISTATWDPEPQTDGLEIRFGRNLEKRHNVQRLNHDTSFPVCTPEFAGRLSDWREANLFDCTGIQANWEIWARQRGETLPEGKLVNLATTYCVSLSAARAGAGLAMGHETLTGDLLKEGTLVRPHEEAVAMEEAYYLVEPPEHEVTPATRTFCDWLLAELL